MSELTPEQQAKLRKELAERAEAVGRSLCVSPQEQLAVERFCESVLRLFNTSDWKLGWRQMCGRLYNDTINRSATAPTEYARYQVVGQAEVLLNLETLLVAWARGVHDTLKPPPAQTGPKL